MTDPDWTLFPLDCRIAMHTCMAPDSVDSIVTDGPYELTSIVKRFGGATAAPAQFGTDGAYARASRGFMGQAWDGTGVVFDADTWREAYRVLKPGGYLLAFGGTRTYHRLAVAIEDAGFEIRDMVDWTYGSGFPKSHDTERSIAMRTCRFPGRHHARELPPEAKRQINDHVCPPTPESLPWLGYGTALKPAHEPIALARKPLSEPSVALNVLRWGTGAINIDGCRVPYDGDADERETKGKNAHADFETGPMSNQIYGRFSRDRDNYDPPGRFPSNFIHDGSPEVLAEFPITGSVGHHPSARGRGGIGNNGHGGQAGLAERTEPGPGSAARFFYSPKASKADREEGCGHLELTIADTDHKIPRSQLDEDRRAGTVPRRNSHPTVKPTALMRYLVRLVTPAGGIVFDPFAGSGSTGKAALLEGRSFIGCEITPEYVPIAEARLAHALAAYQAIDPAVTPGYGEGQ